VWEHAQKLYGGLDVLAGVTSAEQGSGLEALWGTVGALLSAIPGADVIADCGRIGGDGPLYDLLAEAEAVVLVTRASLGEVVRLRDRAAALTNGLGRRGRPGARIGVVVIADHKNFKADLAEVGQAIGQGRGPASVIGGIANEPKSADQLRGEWTGKLDKTLLIRTTREIASTLSAQVASAQLPAAGSAAAQQATGQQATGQPPGRRSGSAVTGRPPGAPRSGSVRPDPLLAAPPAEPRPALGPGTEPGAPEPPALSVQPGPQPRGRHAGRSRAAAAPAGPELPSQLESLPDSPSAPLAGGPAGPPGDHGGW
jgi:hypothetical protein